MQLPSFAKPVSQCADVIWGMSSLTGILIDSEYANTINHGNSYFLFMEAFNKWQISCGQLEYLYTTFIFRSLQIVYGWLHGENSLKHLDDLQRWFIS